MSDAETLISGVTNSEFVMHVVKLEAYRLQSILLTSDWTQHSIFVFIVKINALTELGNLFLILVS